MTTTRDENLDGYFGDFDRRIDERLRQLDHDLQAKLETRFAEAARRLARGYSERRLVQPPLTQPQ